MLILFMKSSLDLQLRKKTLSSLKIIRPILYVGVPGGISSISYSASQVVSTAIIAVLGVTTMSANIYLSTIFFYVYVIGLSLGLACSLIIGWLVGAHDFDRAYRLSQQTLKITILINITCSLCIFIFGESIIRLFTDNAEIVVIAKTIMFIDIFVEIGRAFNHVENNALRGAGDVLYSMVVSILSCWLISILLAYVLCIKLNMGLPGCWIAFAIDEFFRGIVFYRRFESRKWTKKVLT
jgi:Na+-driven multidrug efflux pump